MTCVYVRVHVGTNSFYFDELLEMICIVLASTVCNKDHCLVDCHVCLTKEQLKKYITMKLVHNITTMNCSYTLLP